MAHGNEIFGQRLKEARTAAKLSQKELGVAAGLDQFVASTRINRYELAVHKADYLIAQSLAAILEVPTGFFYTEDDRLAELMVIFHHLPVRRKAELLKTSRKLLDGVKDHDSQG